MRPISQRMLELTDSRDGISTPQIVDVLWPGVRDQVSERSQHLLSKTRDALAIHEHHGRVRRIGYAYGTYNNARSIVWKITPMGRSWLLINAPEKVAARREANRAIAADRARRKANCERLLEEARESFGKGTPAVTRRQVSRLLRAEGCTLQSIADIFGVTRELIRVDCKNLIYDYRLSEQERTEIFGKSA